MVQLTKLAVKRPVTIVLCLITIVYFGIQSLLGARIELIPDIELPMLVMSTVYTGASPDDINELITSKQEDAIASLSGVDTVQTYSMENVAVVLVQYEYGTDIDTAYINLKKAVDAIRSDLPDDAKEPTIMELDINSSAVVTLAVSGDVNENLYNYVDNNIVPELEKLSAVGEVSISGGQKNYVRIELQPDKLEQYHLSISQIGQIVGAADFTIPAGDVNVGKKNLDVSVGKDYDDIESIKKIPIALGNGSVIHLSDVAKVYETLEEADSISRYNAQDIISISIKKQQSATAIDVSDQVMKEIETLKLKNPAITYTVTDDSSEMIRDSIADVFQTVVSAVILSMIVLWLFCGDLRASLIIGVSIISSIVLALISVSAMGYSLNVISLTSLVFGVGMMVDNSINVLDGCFRAKEKMNYYDAAIEGSRTMIGAITGGTVTNCIVFVPLLLLKGITGQMFTQLAATIIFCLTASLFSAVAIVPLGFFMWHPQESERAPINGLMKGMQRWYRSHMPRFIKKTKVIFITTIGLLAVSILLATQLGVELMPASDEGIVNITIKTQPGLNVAAVSETVSGIEKMVLADENVDSALLTYGSSGLSLSSSSDVSLTAYLKDDRKQSTDEVIDKWMEDLASCQNCTVSMESGSSTNSGMSTGNQIEIDLQSADYDLVKADSDQLVAALRKRPDVMQVHSSIENAAPIVKVEIDPVKAQAEGLTPSSIGSLIYNNLSGVKAATVQINNQDVDVIVEFAPDRYDSVDKLQGMMITTATGTTLPLCDLAEIFYQDSPQQIVRQDEQYRVSITMLASSGYEKAKVEKEIKSFAGGYKYSLGVESVANANDESISEEIGALAGALVTAIFLIFIAMAIQFESPKYSLMVMITIPFSLIGAFGFLYLFDSPISMTSMLGFLMMVGNVVNGGILYVESVSQMQEKMSLDEALVEAGAIRMRPILMTVTIAVISEIPNVVAYGESGTTMQGAALVNVGGLVASTALMLLMLPTFYRVMYGLGRKRYDDHEPAID